MGELVKQRGNAVLLCTCSGSCPSMGKIDFWALAERVRLEAGDKVQFMALHPRLCEEDGERFMGQVLDDTIHAITPACAFPDIEQTKRLLRDLLQGRSARRPS